MRCVLCARAFVCAVMGFLCCPALFRVNWIGFALVSSDVYVTIRCRASTIFASLMADADGLELPDGVLTVGPEIARGSNGVVHEATLYGGPVCAKVRVCHERLCGVGVAVAARVALMVPSLSLQSLKFVVCTALSPRDCLRVCCGVSRTGQ
jgi:hypothetical protein